MSLVYLYNYYLGMLMTSEDIDGSIMADLMPGEDVLAPLMDLAGEFLSSEEEEASEDEMPDAVFLEGEEEVSSASEEEEPVDEEDVESDVEDSEEGSETDESEEETLEEPVVLKNPNREDANLAVLAAVAFLALLAAVAVSDKMFRWMPNPNTPTLNTIAFEQLKNDYSQAGRVILDVPRLHECLQKFNQLSLKAQLLTNSWTPMPAKFEGVSEFLQATGKNGTRYAEAMYLGKPQFFWNRMYGSMEMHQYFEGAWMATSVVGKMEDGGDSCVVKNGILKVRQSYRGSSGELNEYMRVYYVKTSDLMQLFG